MCVCVNTNCLVLCGGGVIPQGGWLVGVKFVVSSTDKMSVESLEVRVLLQRIRLEIEKNKILKGNQDSIKLLDQRYHGLCKKFAKCQTHLASIERSIVTVQREILNLALYNYSESKMKVETVALYRHCVDNRKCIVRFGKHEKDFGYVRVRMYNSVDPQAFWRTCVRKLGVKNRGIVWLDRQCFKIKSILDIEYELMQNANCKSAHPYIEKYFIPNFNYIATVMDETSLIESNIVNLYSDFGQKRFDDREWIHDQVEQRGDEREQLQKHQQLNEQQQQQQQQQHHQQQQWKQQWHKEEHDL